jgi:hypothetical protein
VAPPDAAPPDGAPESVIDELLVACATQAPSTHARPLPQPEAGQL